MLRRDPTLVALRDTDVQEIKEMTLKRQQDTATTGSNQLGGNAVPLTTDQVLKVVAIEQAKKEREALSRNQRLGLE
jgi:hypothetical protein